MLVARQTLWVPSNLIATAFDLLPELKTTTDSITPSAGYWYLTRTTSVG
jgi:hypothetical protein